MIRVTFETMSRPSTRASFERRQPFPTISPRRSAQRLPDGADARYLHGIVRNIAAQSEGEHIGRRLFALRLEARDAMLASLVAARDGVCAGHDASRVGADCVDRALGVESPLDEEALASERRALYDQDRDRTTTDCHRSGGVRRRALGRVVHSVVHSRFRRARWWPLVGRVFAFVSSQCEGGDLNPYGFTR